MIRKEEVIKRNPEGWQRLADHIGGATGDSIVDAFADFFTLYTPDVVEWYAGLYDKESGGYYYSNSARDNEKVEFMGKEYLLLPDVESTAQAMHFWRSSGICAGYEKYADAIPTEMRNKIIEFTRGLQDPDGYFYHKQWGKDINIPRRARDLNWSMGIFRDLGGEPKYPTILNQNSEKKNEATLVPEHLSSPEKFKKYLEDMNFSEKSFHRGHELSSQASQIYACGLGDTVVDFLDAKQDANTGLWHNKSDYYGVNGLFKVLGVYCTVKKPLPNAMAAANSVIDAIISTEPIDAVVDLGNTWGSLNRIVSNLRDFGGDEGAKQADEILKHMFNRAPEALKRSREKISEFGHPDGSFSYRRTYSNYISQNMPVAIPKSEEGDINGSMIASMYLIGGLFFALGLTDYKVLPFGKEERERYIAALNK